MHVCMYTCMYVCMYVRMYTNLTGQIKVNHRDIYPMCHGNGQEYVSDISCCHGNGRYIPWSWQLSSYFNYALLFTSIHSAHISGKSYWPLLEQRKKALATVLRLSTTSFQFHMTTFPNLQEIYSTGNQN